MRSPSRGVTSQGTGGEPSTPRMALATPNWSLKIHAIMIDATTGATISGNTMSVRATLRPQNVRFRRSAKTRPRTTPPATDRIMKPKVLTRTTPRKCASVRTRRKFLNPTNGCSASVSE